MSQTGAPGREAATDLRPADGKPSLIRLDKALDDHTADEQSLIYSLEMNIRALPGTLARADSSGDKTFDEVLSEATAVEGETTWRYHSKPGPVGENGVRALADADHENRTVSFYNGMVGLLPGKPAKFIAFYEGGYRTRLLPGEAGLRHVVAHELAHLTATNHTTYEKTRFGGEVRADSFARFLAPFWR